MAAAEANRFEIAEGELALSRTFDRKLKAFAERMVKDHVAGLQKLRQAARAAHVAVPVDIPLSQDHQSLIQALGKHSGAEFDQAYRTDQIQAHDRTLALLDRYRASGADLHLRAWAGATAAMVEAHRRHLQAMRTPEAGGRHHEPA